jgi:allantoicase
MTESTGDPSYVALPDLASRALGGSVIGANDELFAERENLITPGAAAYRPHTFGPKGQVYDGWETRRRRSPGHDFAVVRLGLPGVVRGVVVDTAWFTGNYPPEVSVEGAAVEDYPSAQAMERADWVPLVPRSSVQGDTRNAFVVNLSQRFTHVRLCIYPDGGVARLRVHGEPVPDPRLLDVGSIDLAALENGGAVLDASNRFYSAPANLLAPGLARVMGDGWETARRRDDGNDWVLVQLAGVGRVRLLELDTSHFKGNAPGEAAVSGCDARSDPVEDPQSWFPALARRPLQPDTRHRLPLAGDREVTHLRLDVYPDGGMARLRAYGDLSRDGRVGVALRWLNLLPEPHAMTVLTGQCRLSADDARAVLAARPFADAETVPAELRALVAGGQ